MFKIEIHKTYNQITSVFYRFGIWRSNDETYQVVKMFQITYLIFYAMFPVSLAFGAFMSDNLNATIFLADEATATLVVTLKFAYILWKQAEIQSLLHDISSYSIEDQKQFLQIKLKLKNFINFVQFYLWLVVVGCGFLLCLPLFSNEKKLPFNIHFRLEWSYSEIAYLMAYSYITLALVLSCVCVLLNPIIWYIMLNCSVKYQILGRKFRSMGVRKSATLGPPLLVDEKHLFLQDLVESIKSYQDLRKYVLARTQ